MAEGEEGKNFSNNTLVTPPLAVLYVENLGINRKIVISNAPDVKLLIILIKIVGLRI